MRAKLPGKYLIATFAEELVCRAYLITRLEVLLRSRLWAVLLSAGAFASYHAYQGVNGTTFAFLFGVSFGAIYLFLRRVWPLALGHAMYDVLLELSH